MTTVRDIHGIRLPYAVGRQAADTVALAALVGRLEKAGVIDAHELNGRLADIASVENVLREELAALFPDVSFENIPPVLVDGVRDGLESIVATIRHEIDEGS